MSSQSPQKSFVFRVAALTAMAALPLSVAMVELAGDHARADLGVRVEQAGATCLARGDALLRHLQSGLSADNLREADAFEAYRCAQNSPGWAVLRRQLRNHPADERRRILAGDMTRVLGAIGDASRLTYEFDPTAHQLARALSYALPKVQARVWDAATGQTRVATAKYQATGMAQLSVADGELTTAIASSPRLGSALQGPRQHLLASANAYSSLLDAYENGPFDLRFKDLRIRVARQRVLADSDAVFASAHAALARLLADRVEHARAQLRLLWSLFAGSLAATFGLAWLIAGSVAVRERRVRRELEQDAWRLQAEIARDLAELEVEAREARFQAIFAGSPLAIAIVDSAGAVVEFNEAYLQLVGSASAERLPRTLFDTVRVDPPEALSGILAHVRGATLRTYQVDVLISGRGERRLWFHAVVSGVRNGSGAPLYFTVMLQDITDRKERERLYLHEATHDSLTGLPNRAFVVSALEERLRCDEAIPRFAVLFLDVNDFKSINDTLGHRAGDDCLQNVALRLAPLVRERDVVARFGGDEFVILLSDAHSIEQAREVVARIGNAFRTPLVFDDVAVTLSLSAGLLVDRCDFDSAEQVLREADRAMYDEKFGAPKRLATIQAFRQATPGRS